jgi:hypothetical protein
MHSISRAALLPQFKVMNKNSRCKDMVFQIGSAFAEGQEVHRDNSAYWIKQ